MTSVLIKMGIFGHRHTGKMMPSKDEAGDLGDASMSQSARDYQKSTLSALR